MTRPDRLTLATIAAHGRPADHPRMVALVFDVVDAYLDHTRPVTYPDELRDDLETATKNPALCITKKMRARAGELLEAVNARIASGRN